MNESQAVKKTKLMQDAEKTVNAITGKDQRGTKLLDGIINEINGINNTYIAGMESCLKIRPTRDELAKENAKLKEELAELKNLCTKEQLAELEYVLRRQKEDNEKETK